MAKLTITSNSPSNLNHARNLLTKDGWQEENKCENITIFTNDMIRTQKEVRERLEGKYDGKRIHSWRLWKALNDNIEAVLTGLPARLTDLKEFVGNSWCRSEILRGEVFLQELLAGSN